MPKNLSTVNKLFSERKWGEALELIIDIEKNKDLSSNERLPLLILKGFIYYVTLNLKEVVKVGEIAYSLSKELKNKFAMFDALAFKSMVMYIGDLKKAREYVLDSEKLLTSLIESSNADLSRQIVDLNYRKSWLFYFEGNLNNSLEIAIPNLEKSKKYDIEGGYTPFILMLLSQICHMKGDLDLGLDFISRALNMNKEQNNQDGVSECEAITGYIYYNKGEIIKALEYCEQALEDDDINNISKETKFRLLGNIFREKGELDLSLKYFSRAIEIAEQESSLWHLTQMLGEKGAVYRIMGNYDLAVGVLERGVGISREIGYIPGLLYCLVFLVLIYLDKNDRTKANNYFTELDKLIDQTDYKF
ncbi:MAG: tetratricopeptide repeat protein, partial [Promethearchaeota archaeon]